MIDCAKSDSNFNPILLRYFNPIVAHESGMIGEDLNGISNNLVPYIAQVAAIKKFEHEIPYRVVPRRTGDIAECYAAPKKAKDELGWGVHKGLDNMCFDAWKWQEAGGHAPVSESFSSN